MGASQQHTCILDSTMVGAPLFNMLLLLLVAICCGIGCNVFNSNDATYRKVQCAGTPSQQVCITMTCQNFVSGVGEVVGKCATKTQCEVAKVNGKCHTVSCCDSDWCNPLPVP